MDSSLDHVVLVNNAKRALERGRFELTYQPIYSVDQREVDSVETLLRWRIAPGRLAAAQDFRAVFRDPMMSLSISRLRPDDYAAPGGALAGRGPRHGAHQRQYHGL
ncbi:MAG: EAL domain-containing protein [Agrobacterium tumefaciens]